MKITTPDQWKEEVLQAETMLSQYYHLLNNLNRRMESARNRQDRRLLALLEEEKTFILRHI
jgi:hypothetical protein